MLGTHFKIQHILLNIMSSSCHEQFDFDSDIGKQVSCIRKHVFSHTGTDHATVQSYISFLTQAQLHVWNNAWFLCKTSHKETYLAWRQPVVA